jgi:hypothetical protein
MPDKRNILIFGSCITRDAVCLLENEIEVLWCQARTIVVSMMSLPVEIELDYENSGMPNFEIRNVRYDLSKQWREKLALSADAVVLDFIDERFGLAQTEASAFSYSSAFKAMLPKDAARPFTRFVPPHSEAYLDLTKQYLPAFCDQLADVPRLVVTDTVWTGRTEPGAAVPQHMFDMVDACNRLLDTIYEELARRTNASFLAIPREELIAKHNHRWGDALFHYSDDNERLIAKRLNEEIRRPIV